MYNSQGGQVEVRYKVIDNKRLNIYLTKQDLQKENVSIEDIVDGSPESVIKIRKIFSVVSGLADFAIQDVGLNIVLMPIVDGDLLISACVERNQSDFTNFKEVFVYKDFEDLLGAVIKGGIKDTVVSSLYIISTRYYLVIEASEDMKSECKCLVENFLEFGQRSDLGDKYISEHGKNVIKNNAIEKLNEYFFKK